MYNTAGHLLLLSYLLGMYSLQSSWLMRIHYHFDFQDRKSTRLNSSHTVIYTLSLHDALPILNVQYSGSLAPTFVSAWNVLLTVKLAYAHTLSLRFPRSEEHTSELQSHSDLHSFPTRRSSDLKCTIQRVTCSYFRICLECTPYSQAGLCAYTITSIS